MSISNEELHQWVSGLFCHVVGEHMYAMIRLGNGGKDLSPEEEERAKPALLEAAFGEVVEMFPDPLRSKLLAERADFVAMMLKMS